MKIKRCFCEERKTNKWNRTLLLSVKGLLIFIISPQLLIVGMAHYILGLARFRPDCGNSFLLL